MSEILEAEKWVEMYKLLRTPGNGFAKRTDESSGEEFPGINYHMFQEPVRNPNGAYNFKDAYFHFFAFSHDKGNEDFLKIAINGTRISEIDLRETSVRNSMGYSRVEGLYLPKENLRFILGTLEMFGVLSDDGRSYSPDRVPDEIRARITDPLWKTFSDKL